MEIKFPKTEDEDLDFPRFEGYRNLSRIWLYKILAHMLTKVVAENASPEHVPN